MYTSMRGAFNPLQAIDCNSVQPAATSQCGAFCNFGKNVNVSGIVAVRLDRNRCILKISHVLGEADANERGDGGRISGED